MTMKNAFGDLALDATLSAVLTKLNTGVNVTVTDGSEPITIDGAVTVSNFPAIQAISGTFWQGIQPVSFTWAGLTDAQLRATPIPISVASLPLPAGAATQSTLATLLTAAQAIQAAAEALNTKTTTVNTGAVALTSPTVTALTATTGSHFQPGFDVSAGVGTGGPLQTDPDGNLVARAQVLTDELGYRCNFANTSLAVSIGSAVFTNGSDTVTGAGFISADVRADDYVKLNADIEAAWVQVMSVNSDSALTLVSPYTGTGGTGAASRSILKPVTGAGGAIAVASGVCTLTAGTTAGSIIEIERDVDWLPLVKQTGVAISQRIANQGTYIGFYDELAPAAPKWFAWFLADGTANTTVKCQSARNPTNAPSVVEIEETVVTLPNGATTATTRRYRPEVLGDRVNFFIDGILMATHFKAMPGPGDLLTSTVRILNGTTPASSTVVTVDYDTVKNHNKLEVGLLSDNEQIIGMQPTAQMFNYTAGAVIIPINTDIMTIDCSQLRSLSILSGAVGTTGVVTGAWSNDGVTDWLTATLVSESGTASTTFTGASALLRTTSVRGRYFRLRMTTATTAAGATRINVAGFQTDITPVITTQPVSGTVTATVTGYPTAAASADALANPTVTQVGAAALNFNGTTWDRVRNNAIVTMGDTGAKIVTFNGATQTNFNASGAMITVAVGAVSGTTPTLSCQLQVSYDGTNFINYGPASANIVASTQTCTFMVYPANLSQAAGATPANLTIGANQAIAINAPLPRTWRIVYTIGGTTPSFTLTNAYAAYIA